MLPLLILLFTVIPALELFLLYEIGSKIGIFSTVIIILITGVVGAILAKAQGLAILFNVQKDLNEGKMPADQIIHGLIVFGGGLLLLTPGFMTDILGFLMVLPGSRHLIVKSITAYFKKGIESGNIRFAQFSTNIFNDDSDSQKRWEEENSKFNERPIEGDVFEAEYKTKDDAD